MNVNRFTAIICRHCGEGLVECPRCRERGEYALICVSRDCGASGKGLRRQSTQYAKAQRLRAKNIEAGQCVVCPLGSPELTSGTLCDQHKAAQRQRWAKVEARKTA